MNALDFILELKTVCNIGEERQIVLDETAFNVATITPHYGIEDPTEETPERWTYEYISVYHPDREVLGYETPAGVYSRYLDAMVASIQEEWERETDHVRDRTDMNTSIRFHGLNTVPLDKYCEVFIRLKVAAAAIANAMPTE